MNRRTFLTRSCGAALGLAAGGTIWRSLAQEGSPVAGMVTPATQRAIDQSLLWLSRQQHQDGSFGTGNYHGNVAVSSLAGLALMAGGHQPGRGAYGENVTRA